uniref:Uncharacterized protein n=1 Tax=Cannabis sativa TaxID=3483 RepID=A0A803QF36_CANSA
MKGDELVEGKLDWKGRTALKYKHGGFRASMLILGTFAFENLATLALAVNLITYFIAFLHFQVADAANHLTNFMGTSYILSILMALLADTLVGRFRITLISALLELMGFTLLTIQASMPKLKPPPCNLLDPTATCEEISGGNKALLFVGLYMLACGSGGLKAGLPTHGADQFEENDPKEAKQMSSFFNLLLLALCLGGAISLTLLVWIQDNKGWDWGFGVSTIAIFLSIILFAQTMDRSVISPSFKIPPASLAILPVIFLIFLIPIYDRLVVPFLRRLTGIPTGVTHLQRIGVGLILSAISMAVAAILEVKRKGVARDHGLLEAIPQVQALPISIFWLSFQYFIFGIADMFTYVGLLEFFYSEAPKALKSFSTSFLWTSMALGYFLSTILVKIVNSATKKSTRSGGWLVGNNLNTNHLNLFYWLLSIMSLINFVVYLFVAKRYKYRVQISTSPTNVNYYHSNEIEQKSNAL